MTKRSPPFSNWPSVSGGDIENDKNNDKCNIDNDDDGDGDGDGDNEYDDILYLHKLTETLIFSPILKNESR